MTNVISEHIRKSMGNECNARKYTPISDLEINLEEKPWQGKRTTGIKGVERMYGSEIAIIASTECAARCVACIRKGYTDNDVMKCGDLDNLARYVNKNRIKEVLITGGDPFMTPDYTLEIVRKISETTAKHIKIGTAMFRADPGRITSSFIDSLRQLNRTPGYLEVSPHIDHPQEFTPETNDKIRQFNEAGINLYAQTILLRGINDNPTTFRELAEQIRDNGIEWHYLFHCVPVKGNLHLRTSVQKGFELIGSLENHMEVTGRHIPKRYTIPLPIGKVYMDPSRIVAKEGYYLWIETRYSPETLRGTMPDSCRIGKRGFLEVKYLDGKDE